MARTAAVASDDFNRAAPLGANWTNINSDWAAPTINGAGTRVIGNTANLPSNEGCVRWAGSGTFNNDQWASIKVYPNFNTSGYGIGVMVRSSADVNAGRDSYQAYVEYSAAGPDYTTILRKVVNGTVTVLHSATNAWTGGDRLDIEAEGSTIRLCKNGTPLGGSFTVTDTALTTGQPGVVASGGSTEEGDDWEAGNFASAGVVNARNGIALSGISAINGITKTGVSAINGLTI